MVSLACSAAAAAATSSVTHWLKLSRSDCMALRFVGCLRFRCSRRCLLSLKVLPVTQNKTKFTLQRILLFIIDTRVLLTAMFANKWPSGIVWPHVALVMALPDEAFVANAALVLKSTLVRGHVRAERPLGLERLLAVLAADLGRGRGWAGAQRGRHGLVAVFAQQKHVLEAVLVLAVMSGAVMRTTGYGGSSRGRRQWRRWNVRWLVARGRGERRRVLESQEWLALE